MLDTILVPLDGSALAERALDYAQPIACLARARLVLLRATSALPVLRKVNWLMAARLSQSPKLDALCARRKARKRRFMVSPSLQGNPLPLRHNAGVGMPVASACRPHGCTDELAPMSPAAIDRSSKFPQNSLRMFSI